MDILDGYYLRKKEQSELNMGEILYHKSMKPEEKLEKLYEIVEPMELGVDPNANYQQRFFSEFNNSEKMYPKMLKGQRKALWDRRYSEMEELKETRKKAKSQVHTNFMLSNPELELVKDLHNTPYGKELMSEVARNQRRQPESGTGESIHDELERDSVDMEAVPQFQSKPFMIPGTDESFAKLDLERDDNGRIIKRSFDVYPIKIEYRYEYDGEGRLKNVYCDRNTTEDYRYGEYGERVAIETSRVRPHWYTYNDNLQLVKTAKIKYTYDDKGRLVSKNEFGKITQYSYLESGPLCEVILPDGKRIEYTSNPVGQRTSKAVNGKIVETYLWQDLTTLLVVADEKGNNAKIFKYDEEGDPIGMIYQDKKYLFATDQVGTIFMVADDKGNELKRVIYDSFGNLLVDTKKKFDTCVGFSAGLADKDTGLVHFGYREYDPRIGRFITPDPIGLAGGDVDVYGYCLDDPINFVDRTGLFGEFGSGDDGTSGFSGSDLGGYSGYSGVSMGGSSGSELGGYSGYSGVSTGGSAGSDLGGYSGYTGYAGPSFSDYVGKDFGSEYGGTSSKNPTQNAVKTSVQNAREMEKLAEKKAHQARVEKLADEKTKKDRQARADEERRDKQRRAALIASKKGKKNKNDLTLLDFGKGALKGGVTGAAGWISYGRPLGPGGTLAAGVTGAFYGAALGLLETIGTKALSDKANVDRNDLDDIFGAFTSAKTKTHKRDFIK